MKKQNLNNRHHRNKKDCKRPLQATYGNKMDNLEEMDKFLEKYSILRLNQEEKDNMNWQVIKLKLWLKIFQQTKAQDQMVS